jgi:hypothetical protein
MRLLLVAGLIALLALIFYLMHRRWKLLTTQSEFSYPPVVENAPNSFVPTGVVAGLFLGTSPASNWMLRVMSQDLGVRSRATCQWSPDGLFFTRAGATDVYIDMGLVLNVGFGRGVAGTVRAKGSVLVIRWQLGEAILDSGFRADTSEGHQELVELENYLKEKLGPIS